MILWLIYFYLKLSYSFTNVAFIVNVLCLLDPLLVLPRPRLVRLDEGHGRRLDAEDGKAAPRGLFQLGEQFAHNGVHVVKRDVLCPPGDIFGFPCGKNDITQNNAPIDYNGRLSFPRTSMARFVHM